MAYQTNAYMVIFWHVTAPSAISIMACSSKINTNNWFFKEAVEPHYT